MSRCLALLLLLGASPASSATPPDALSALEGDRSPEALGKLERLYRQAKNPYARLWVLDALYRRVESFHEEPALEVLLSACKDENPELRRHAVGGLKAWRHLPADRRVEWQTRLREAAVAAEKDESPEVREAGASLRQLLGNRTPAATPRTSRRRETSPDLWKGLLLWTACVQIAGLLWYRMGISLLDQSGEPGRLAGDSIRLLYSRADFLLFPCLSAALLLAVVGVAGGRAIGGAIRVLGERPEPLGTPAFLRFWMGFYLAAGLSVFVPAALLAQSASLPQAGFWCGAGRALRAVPSLVSLGVYLLVAVWPWEFLVRRGSSRWAWMCRVGAPLSGYLTAALMAKDGLGWGKASERARELFDSESGPATGWLGRPLRQVPLVLLMLCAPLFFAFSLLPSRLLGLEPTKLLDLWFVSDGAFARSFGLWLGAIASSMFLAFLSAAAAAYAAKRASEAA